jgi:hypothetical protein
MRRIRKRINDFATPEPSPARHNASSGLSTPRPPEGLDVCVESTGVTTS